MAPDRSAPSDELTSPWARGAGSGAGGPRPARWLALVAALGAIVPIVVACVRAIAQHWVPAGDNGFIAVRTRDVLSAHPPELGLWASVSFGLPFDVNHPGPLFFDLLALPDRLPGRGVGLVTGVAVLNAAAVVGVVTLAWRRGGPLLASAAAAVTSALAWSMGSAILTEPWHAHSVLLPFLCFVFLVWSLACGDVVALPWAALVGSLVLETNLSYALLVPLLGAWGGGALAMRLRRARRDDPTGWSSTARRMRRVGVLTVTVVAACWAQPVVEELRGGRDGNFGRLLRAAEHHISAMGFNGGLRAFAKVVALPPWWFRSSMRDDFPYTPFGTPLPSTAPAVLSLLVLGALLVLGLRSARRRADGVALQALAVAVVLAAVGLVTAMRSPVTVYGVAAYQTRWLWSVAAFVTFALLAVAARAAAARFPERMGTLTAVLTIAALAAGVADLPASNQGTNVRSADVPVARRLVAQLARQHLHGPLRYESFGTVFDPYGPAVLAELRRLDVPFVVGPRDHLRIRQLGSARRIASENDAKGVLTVATGDTVLHTPLFARRVALGVGLDRAEQREIGGLQRELRAYLATRGVHLDDRGLRAFRRHDLPSLPRGFPHTPVDVAKLFAPRRDLLGYYNRDLQVLVRERMLVVPPAWQRRFERYTDLQERWDTQTAAVFLRPLPLPSFGAPPPTTPTVPPRPAVAIPG